MMFKLRDFKNLKQRKSWQPVASVLIAALFICGSIAFNSDNLSLKKVVSAKGECTGICPGGACSGALFKELDDYKVYIAKGAFCKRWIQTQEILNCYEHLRTIHPDSWLVNPGYADTKLTTWLVRVEGDCKVYEINGDMTKHWLNMTAEQFIETGRSWDMISIINDCELNLYTAGSQVLFLDF